MSNFNLEDLQLSRSDWAHVPTKIVRQRFAPLLLASLLCVGVACLYAYDGYRHQRPHAFDSAKNVLWLLVIPLFFAFYFYIEIVIDLKLRKLNQLIHDNNRVDVQEQ